MNIFKRAWEALFPPSFNELEKREQAERNKKLIVKDRRRLRIPDMADMDYEDGDPRKQTRRDDGDENTGFTFRREEEI